MVIPIFASFLAGSPSLQMHAKLVVMNPRVEYLKNPMGVDSPHPRFTWFVTSEQRGDRQTKFQVLVSRTKEDLLHNRGAVWNSGKVTSDALGIAYSGPALVSGEQYFWKVRAYDAQGKDSYWSAIHSWSMGLLRRSDWKAEWISSPILADPANRPRTPINCYRSELSTNPNSQKWITLDLGNSHSFDRIVLMPARPSSINHDIKTVQFPRQFRLEASDESSFKNPRLLFSQVGTDYPEPRTTNIEFKFPESRARFIRLVVTKLGEWDAQDFGIFLARFAAYRGNTNVSIGAGVTASDSIESNQWSTQFLVAEQSKVDFAPFPTPLDPQVPDISSSSRTTMLRRDFSLEAPIRKATLHATAKGFYEARINGKKVGEDLLAPGFTDFNKRISYESYDVTALLHKGSNALGALLGYGWYAGHMNLVGNGYFYGYFPQFAAQLDIELTNGKRITIGTDKQWRTTLEGSVRWSDILDGEACDLRRDMPGWDKPGFAANDWKLAWSQALGNAQLVTQKTPPVRIIRELKPLSRKEVHPGVWVYDLGQEVTGWVRIKTDGPRGTHIVLRHVEAISSNGELDASSLWGTAQRDDYILDGSGPRTLEPHFTYHGFRYFEVSGLASVPKDDTLTVINVHTNVDEVGQFECSNPLFNRLMTASKWTQRNMMFDVPAGCAARSERLAWTGDIRPCVQTSLFNFDTTAFFEKYSADLRDDQKPDGRYTDIAPHAHLSGTDICVGSPGWADAGVSLPWEVYVNTGDSQLLAEHFESAKRWVDFVAHENPNFIWMNGRGMDWGDWLSAGPATPKELGATAFFAHSTDLVARMAKALGRTDEAKKYDSLFKNIKAAFASRFVSSKGIVRQPLALQQADVKNTIEHLIMEGRLSLVVTNETFGIDPAPNVPKTLHLKYSVGGSLQSRSFAEKESVKLGGSKPIKIIEAKYGALQREDDDVQGSYALALHFNLLDQPLRTKATQRLLDVIKRDGGHPTTGFWSSTELVLALSDLGHNQEASQMANLTTYPSWGHMVTSGGTTFWEAFDADKKTLSLNHWTHSACGEWLWRNVAGLNPDPEKPGYKGFTIRPLPSAEVTWCKASYQSIRGPIKVQWSVTKGKFALDIQVPPGSTAQVLIPGLPASVRESDNPIGQAEGVRLIKKEAGSALCEVASGHYAFTADFPMTK